MKLSEKAKEMNLTNKELVDLLTEEGYDHKSPNSILSTEALEFLNNFGNVVATSSEAVEQAAVIPVKDKFHLVRFNIDSKLNLTEVARVVYDSKVRAYYELNYLVSKYEQGR